MAGPLGPGNWDVGVVLADFGLDHEALALLRRCGLEDLVRLESNDLPDAMMGLSAMIALMQLNGESEEAGRLLPILVDYSATALDHGAHTHFYRRLRAQALALAGRKDEALEQVGLAIDAPGLPLARSRFENDPAFRSLRDEPRFKEHMQRMRQRQAELRARMPETFRRHGLPWPPS
jgi:hypothetical protein